MDANFDYIIIYGKSSSGGGVVSRVSLTSGQDVPRFESSCRRTNLGKLALHHLSHLTQVFKGCLSSGDGICVSLDCSADLELQVGRMLPGKRYIESTGQWLGVIIRSASFEPAWIL
jgi:hypothetical protein